MYKNLLYDIRTNITEFSFIQIEIFFRMYSTVIGNGRTLQNDMIICGYHVPKGVSE